MVREAAFLAGLIILWKDGFLTLLPLLLRGRRGLLTVRAVTVVIAGVSPPATRPGTGPADSAFGFYLTEIKR